MLRRLRPRQHSPVNTLQWVIIHCDTSVIHCQRADDPMGTNSNDAPIITNAHAADEGRQETFQFVINGFELFNLIREFIG